MSVSEHANYLLNEYGRLQFDYAAYCKPYGESLRNEARNNLEDYIAELEAAQRWIPVGERLPEKAKFVLVVDDRGFLDVDYLWNVEIGGDGFMCSAATVTHWMPLPEPPIVYGKEREE